MKVAKMSRSKGLVFLLLVTAIEGGPWKMPMIEDPLSLSLDSVPSSRLIQSEVNCTTNGIFPVIGSCQDYYHCEDWDTQNMHIYKFTCPTGTIFDDYLDTCNFLSLVKTRSSCADVDIDYAIRSTVEEPNNSDITYKAEILDSADLAIRKLIIDAKQHRFKRESDINQEESFTGENDTAVLGIINDEYLDTEENNQTEKCNDQVKEVLTNDKDVLTSESVAKNAKEACVQIYNVDQYVTLLKSMIPVSYPQFLREVFANPTVDEYNQVLKTAQNHTYIWRQGEDIVSGFRRTYYLAKLFGPEFYRKYDIFQEKLKMMENSTFNQRDRKELEEDIEMLKGSINHYRFLVQITENEEVLTKLELKVVKYENRLEKKIKKLKDFLTAEKIINEIVSFLTFVRDDASNIKERANITMGKLKTFRDNTIHDQAAFIQSRGKANASMMEVGIKLQNSIEKTHQYLKRKEEAERNQERLSEESAQAEAEIDKIIEEMRDFLNEYSKAIEEAARLNAIGSSLSILGKVMKLVGIGLNFIPGVGSVLGIVAKVVSTAISIVGGGLKGAAAESVSHYPKIANQKQEQDTKIIDIYMKRVLQKEEQISKINRDIFDLEDEILKGNQETRSLGYVDYYLMTIINEVNKILPYIEDAIQSLGQIEHTFENIVFNLESLISSAREAKEPAEEATFKGIFLVDVSRMQTNWNNSYSDIINIGSCTELEYYNAVIESTKNVEALRNSVLITKLNCTASLETPSNIINTTEFTVNITSSEPMSDNFII